MRERATHAPAKQLGGKPIRPISPERCGGATGPKAGVTRAFLISPLSRVDGNAPERLNPDYESGERLVAIARTASPQHMQYTRQRSGFIGLTSKDHLSSSHATITKRKWRGYVPAFIWTKDLSVRNLRGGSATPNQSFTLRQSPLTFVQAPTPTGSQSTLNVRANSVSWSEVPTLYGQGPSQQVFASLNHADGTTDVFFGDGTEGATLPTGVNNIIASYRIGSGSAGNVAAGAISTLIDRPLGVNGVNNPQAATGGHERTDQRRHPRQCVTNGLLRSPT
jgi:hypothetical protein